MKFLNVTATIILKPVFEGDVLKAGTPLDISGAIANSDAAAFKTFLAEQYAQGTPVIVLFALATETTESVTPQALHTNAGDNTISVTANVSPIQLEAVYMKGA